MDLFFLEADRPITKRYSQDPAGKLLKHPYPFVYTVTSHLEQAKDLQDFHKALLAHAALGRTLVKGELSRPLVAESRAGSTDPTAKTSWICLDLDGVERFQSVDLFLGAIGCADVDYILQWSSSMNVENTSGFRCHIFMLLDQPTHPQLLKQWLQGINLNTPNISAQLMLTKTLNSLRWPLDITTCQNDKLLYIAPPKFDKPLKDPFPAAQQRITLELRTQRELHVPTTVLSQEAIRELTHKAVNSLRVAASLPPRRSTKFSYMGQVEYQVKPDSAVVTETKTERGFTYLNLNGGDSWAYYHPEDNPNFIFNFKGEPAYKTEELLPAYWAEVSAKKLANSYQPNAQGLIYLAFRDFNSACYYNGTYDVPNDELKLAMAKNESQLKHFLKQHGQPVGDFIPDWELTFDPQNPVVVDPDAHTLNTYRPSEFFKDSTPPVVRAVPPTINKILLHVLGDLVTRDRFLNWVGCIVQNLDRTGTAWVLHGTQGTGKGLLFHQILTPIFGEWNVTSKRMEEIESDFTGFLKNTFLVFVDEIQAGKSLYHSKVTAKLKNLIVEPTISIREMYKPAYMMRNRTNMIFASNKNDPVEVDPDDRRFNVALRQEVPLKITTSEIDKIPSELGAFYAYLKHLPVNADIARTPLVNDARATIIATGRLSVDVVADNILSGNIEALWDYLPAVKPVGMVGSFNRQPVYESYRRLMIEIVTGVQDSDKLTREELHSVFEWCVGSMPESPNKFTSLLRHHRLHMDHIWKEQRTVRGVKVKWDLDPSWQANAQADIAANRI